ncbi:unnamed protein product [Rotaria socialis]
MSSRQNNITNEMRLVNEPRDAFTATYLLRRLNTLFPMQYVRGIERESVGNSANLSTALYPVLTSVSRVDEDNPPQGVIDIEGELDISRTTVEIRSEDGRQQLNSFVTNRVSTHLNERILGAPRCVSRPKSSTVVNLQNRSILDIRPVPAPAPTINPKRITESYQHHPQRQRMTMGIGIRSMPLNEKKPDDPTTYHDSSSMSSSRTLPIRPDNIPINLVSRYETTTLNHLATLNKMQAIRISSVRKSTKNSNSQSSSIGVESGQMLTKLTSDNDGHHQRPVISFHSLNYTLKSQQCCDILPMPCLKKKQQYILNNMSGIFKQGMNAILGSTGSGKSSLLDILADRKDRQGLEGQVLINGEPQASDFKYQVGYVVQDDVVSGNLTVKENLMFSANVRLSTKLSSSEKNQIVDEVIVQLGLEKCANSVVGTEFKRGISGGERKRTNIGMELVLSPNVLFLDEPTTGLDSSTARNIMEYLHQLSRSGRTIIFSIHQPRYSIFKLFDTLFVIAAGHCIYHGPANDVLQFFTSIGFTCEQHDNPADFILDICQGDYRSALLSTELSDTNKPDKNKSQLAQDLHNFYVQSSIYTNMKKQIDSMNSLCNDSSIVMRLKDRLPDKSRLHEIFYVSQRTLRNAFRNPGLIGVQTIMSVFLGILIGLIYMNTDRSMDTGLKNRIGAIFFIATNQVFSSLSALDIFIRERQLFQHENASGYYHVSTYFISKLICDIIPLRTIPSVLFSVIAYFSIGFQQTAAKYFIFFFGILATTLCSSSLCFVVSASVEVFGVANVVAAMFCVLTLVFSGYLVEVDSVVIFLSWIKWISIFRYSTNIFSINEFSGLQLCLKNNTNICPLDGKTILKDQKIEYTSEWDLWKNFVALAGIMLGFLTLTYIQLRRMKKTK